MDHLSPEQFKKLPEDGARFESIVCQLLDAMGYKILEKPAIGTEGGRDVLVERVVADAMTTRHERVVVQCKHHAISGKAVNEGHIGMWQNAMIRYGANGYLLVTDTRVTENVSQMFREYTRTESSKWASFWDVDELIRQINKFPSIRALLLPDQTKKTPLARLANEVATCLRAIRYNVGDESPMNERVFGMVARLQLGALSQSVLVRCFGGEVRSRDVSDAEALLDNKVQQAWLITDKRIAKQARAKSASLGRVKVFALAEFLQEVVWGPYIRYLESEVATNKIVELYVGLSCQSYDGDDGGASRIESLSGLDEYVDSWLTERGKVHLSILGEFGSGKTWFCRHYAYRQMRRYLDNPVSERLPLLITLRNFAKATTVQQVINEALLEQYKLPFIGSAYEIFSEFNRQGKLLLILDGFDEMARRVDYQTVVDNFWELAKLVADESKVILTSRTEYFRQAEESEQVLGGQVLGRSKLELSPPKFEVIHIAPFNRKQVESIIEKRCGREEGKQTAAKILSDERLAELARKPLLIELLLAALTEVPVEALNSTARVYLYATNRLLLRNILSARTFTGTADKLVFLCELAWSMIQKSVLRVHYSEMPEMIKKHFGDRIKDKYELDTWDYDLRNQTLLHRDVAGYFEFAHKSLVEYFAALKFTRDMGVLPFELYAAYKEEDGSPCQLPPPVDDEASLKESVGAISIEDYTLMAVREFVVDMCPANSADRLWQLIERTKGRDFAQVGYIGGNAASLLSGIGASLAGHDLEATVLRGARFSDLTGANLRKADLTGCSLNNPVLRDADLRGAVLNELHVADFSASGQVAWWKNDWICVAWGHCLTLINGRSLKMQWTVAGNTDLYADDVRWSPDGTAIVAWSALDSSYLLVKDIGASSPKVFQGSLASGKRQHLVHSQGMPVAAGVVNNRVHLYKYEGVDPADVVSATTGRSPKTITLICWVQRSDVWELDLREIDVAVDSVPLELGKQEQRRLSRVVLSSTGKLCAVGNPDGSQFYLLQTDLSEAPAMFKGRIVNHGCFDPTDRQFATICGADMIDVWEISTGSRRVLGKNSGGTYMTRLAYSADGSRIAAGRFDATVRIFNVLTGEPEGMVVLRDKCCNGALLDGASGLEQSGYGLGDSQTLQEWLVARGARSGAA